jgi:hypothetical protein
MIRSLNILTVLIIGSLLFSSSGLSESGREHMAELLEDEIIHEIDDDGKVKYTIRRKLIVYGADGDEYASWSVVESQFAKFKNFSATVYNAGGEELNSYKKDDGRKVCGYSGFALYNDVCTWYYWLGSTSYPYTIEFEYSMEFQSLFFWPQWSPQWPIPIKSSSFTLTAPANLEFNIRTVGDIPAAVVTGDEGIKTYEYKLTDVPAVMDEDFVYSIAENMNSLRFFPRNIKLGEYQFDGGSWATLGADCYSMWQGCFALNDRQKALVDSIKVQSSTQRELADKLHEALVKTSRYVAIEIGVGSWRPTPAPETFERGYGDCKDLATMYVSMLRHAGIAATPVLIQTKGSILADKDFPSLRFNHAILFAIVDGDTLWADPTCSYCAMGDLPSHDEDVWVLSLDSAAGQAIKTPASAPIENRIVRKTEIELAGHRNVSVTCELSATGNPGHDLNGFLNYVGQDKLDKFLTSHDFGLSKKIKAEDIAVLNEDNPDSAIKIVARGEIKNAIKTAGPKKYVGLDCLSLLRNCEKIMLKERTMPLDLDYPISYTDTVVFNIPSGWTIEKTPEAVAINEEFGSMQINYTVTDNKLIIACSRESNKYYITPEQIPQFEAYLKKLKTKAPDHIAFVTK